MSWDEKAEAVAQALYPEDRQSHELKRLGATTGFMHGVGSALTWASNDEAVERAARGIHASHDRGDWEHEPAEVLDEYLNMARAALTALIGEDER